MAKPDQQRDRQFKVLKFLGKGSYGSVFLVQRLADSQTYALKEMDVRSMSQAEREDSINEIRLLASVSHPSVVSYNEAFLDGNRLCIIMEYAADGDLAKVIKKQQMMKRPLPEEVIWKYIIQVVMGLQALHNMKILHRDIKPGNIMVFESGVVKIGDLGIAKLLTKTAAAKTQIGTPHYMGPEIWKNRPYSYTSDTWAIGCLLYELTTLNVPFEARSMSELRYKVLRGTYPPIPNTFSRDLQQVVRECLDPNPDKRPSMDALLASPAFASRMKLVPHESRHPPATAGSALVETIKVPRGNMAAIKNKLPPAQYATDMLLNMDRGGHAQMATIEEGNEDETPPMRQPAPPPPRAPGQPPMPPMPPMPKPNYPQPPAPSYQPAPAPPKPQLSALPSIAASHAAGGGAGSRAPPSSHGGGGGGGEWPHLPPAHSKVSESHANYGAFYHQGGPAAGGVYTPSGAAAARNPQPAAPWQAGNKWPPAQPQPQHQHQPSYAQQQQQQQQQYQSPYISPYGGGGQQRAYGAAGGAAGPGAGDMRLPQLNVPKAPPVLVAAAGKAPPPWNYGGQAPSRKNGRAAPMGARGFGHYGDAGQPAAEMPRYPPPQWAPRPARW